MKWTGERPTVPGWYWYPAPGFGEEVVGIYQPNGPDTDELEINDTPVSEFDGEWYGPLEVPA